jgi:hypothetical protein
MDCPISLMYKVEESVLQPPPAASTSSTGAIDNGHPSASAGQPTTTAGFQQLSLLDNLKPNQVVCEYIHRSLLEKVGAIITFISPTYHDDKCPWSWAGSSIPLKVQAPDQGPFNFDSGLPFKGMINNPAGYGENFSAEDYGITFRWTTVSELGAKLCPTGWREGPLYFALCPALIQAVFLHLGQPPDGRTWWTVCQHQLQECIASATERGLTGKGGGGDMKSCPYLTGEPSSKQPRPTTSTVARVPITLTAEDIIWALVRETVALDHETGVKVVSAQTLEQAFPALPPSKQPAPAWHKDGLQDLPDS